MHKKSIIRAISCLLLVSFISYDILWAYPEASSVRSTLAPKTALRDPQHAAETNLLFLEKYIEDPEHNGNVAPQELTLNHVREVLSKHRQEAWFTSIRVDAISPHEVLIRFAPDKVLRYFDSGKGSRGISVAFGEHVVAVSWQSVAFGGGALSKQVLSLDVSSRADRIFSNDAGLGLFEIYANGGREHFTFTKDGQRSVTTIPTEFIPAEQALIMRILLEVTVRIMGDAKKIDVQDLMARIDALGIDRVPDMSAIRDIVSVLSERLGAFIVVNNKGSELEFAIRRGGLIALQNFPELDRAAWKAEIERRLSARAEFFVHKDIKVYAGLEYFKVTLFDKKDIVEKIFSEIPKWEGNVVIGIGDSAVDISFLGLDPHGFEYRPYYVGIPQDVAGNDRISTCGGRCVDASYEILKDAIEKCERGELKLAAIISDIDQSVIKLDEYMEPRMVDLFVRALRRGVRIRLVTGGYLARGYHRWVTDLIEKRYGEIVDAELRALEMARDDFEREKIRQSIKVIEELREPVTVTFVVPMWNETERLLPEKESVNGHGEDALRVKVAQLEALRAINHNFNWHLLLIDDGTENAASEECAKKIWNDMPEKIKPFITFDHVTPQVKKDLNGKKGCAVYRGLKKLLDHIKGYARGKHYKGYTDLDVSTSLLQTGLLLAPLMQGRSGVAIGSRWHKEGGARNVPLMGIISSKVYNWGVRLLLPPLRGIYDTQRGFKLFTTEVLEKIFERHSIESLDQGMSFDTELLLLARLDARATIEEVPIAWVDSVEESKIETLPDSIKMLKGVYSQRRHMSFFFKWGRVWLRCFDVLVATAFFVPAAIITIVCAPIIEFTSPGGVLFEQERVGRNGREFTAYKFRSMHPTETNHDGTPKITRVGKVMRKLALDELPQLWNVFIGDMAVFGPRPLWARKELGEPSHRYEYVRRVLMHRSPGYLGLFAALTGPDKGAFDLSFHYFFEEYEMANWSTLWPVKLIFSVMHAILFKKNIEFRLRLFGLDPKDPKVAEFIKIFENNKPSHGPKRDGDGGMTRRSFILLSSALAAGELLAAGCGVPNSAPALRADLPVIAEPPARFGSRGENRREIEVLKGRIMAGRDDGAVKKLFEFVVYEDTRPPEEHDATDAVAEIIRSAATNLGSGAEFTADESNYASLLRSLMSHACVEKSEKSKQVIVSVNDYLRHLLLDDTAQDKEVRDVIVFAICAGFKYQSAGAHPVADRAMDAFLEELMTVAGKNMFEADRLERTIRTMMFTVDVSCRGTGQPRVAPVFKSKALGREVTRLELYCKDRSLFEVSHAVMTRLFKCLEQLCFTYQSSVEPLLSGGGVWSQTAQNALARECQTLSLLIQCLGAMAEILGVAQVVSPSVDRLDFFIGFYGAQWDMRLSVDADRALEKVIRELFLRLPLYDQMKYAAQCAHSTDMEGLAARLERHYKSGSKKHGESRVELFLNAAAFRLRDIVMGNVDFDLMVEVILNPAFDKTLGQYAKGMGTLWSLVLATTQNIKHFSINCKNKNGNGYDAVAISHVLTIMADEYKKVFEHRIYNADTGKTVIVQHEGDNKFAPDEVGDLMAEGNEVEARHFNNSAEAFKDVIVPNMQRVRSGFTAKDIVTIKGGIKEGEKEKAIGLIHDALVSDPGKDVFHFVVHGLPESISFRKMRHRTDTPDHLGYKELAGMLVERAKKSGDLGELTLIFDSCYGFDYVQNMLTELSAMLLQNKLPRALPFVATAANFNRRSTVGALSQALRMAQAPLTVRSLFEAQDNEELFAREDPALFIPLSEGALGELEKLKNTRTEDVAPYAVVGMAGGVPSEVPGWDPSTPFAKQMETWQKMLGEGIVAKRQIKRVLYVEDTPEVRELTKKFLQICFPDSPDTKVVFEVRERAEDAIDLISNGDEFDLIVTDRNTLSKKTGTDLIAAIRQREQENRRSYADQAIVVMTSGDLENVASEPSYGADGAQRFGPNTFYLKKPFSLKDFIALTKILMADAATMAEEVVTPRVASPDPLHVPTKVVPPIPPDAAIKLNTEEQAEVNRLVDELDAYQAAYIGGDCAVINDAAQKILKTLNNWSRLSRPLQIISSSLRIGRGEVYDCYIGEPIIMLKNCLTSFNEDHDSGMFELFWKIAADVNTLCGQLRIVFALNVPMPAISVIDWGDEVGLLDFANVQINAAHAIHKNFITTHPIPDKAEILLSEDLFIDRSSPENEESSRLELERIRSITLKTLIESGRIKILPSEELRDYAMQETKRGRADKTKMAIVLTEEESKAYSTADKEKLAASVLVVDSTLTGGNYLYLEAIVGLTEALMAGDRQAVGVWYRFLSGTAPDAEALDLLTGQSKNTFTFALRAILRLKPITAYATGERPEEYRRMVEEYLIKA